MAFTDPFGLCAHGDSTKNRVEVCSRVANVTGNYFNARHRWVRTSNMEMGLGGAGAVPGQGQGVTGNVTMMFSTEIIDHSGEGAKPGSVCVVVPQVAESCMNAQLAIGDKRGVWGPMNNCWTVVNEAIRTCRRQNTPTTAARDATNVAPAEGEGAEAEISTLFDE